MGAFDAVVKELERENRRLEEQVEKFTSVTTTLRSNEVRQSSNALAWADWRPAPKAPLAVTVHLTAPNCYAWDCDGRLKLLLDVLMPALGTDDRYIVALTVTKARAAAPATVVTVAAAGEGT